MIVQTLTVGPIQTNCYIVVCEDTRRAAVIDPGWSAPTILAAVESLNTKVGLILLTHAHFDHIGAVADIVDATKAPLALHPLDLPLLRADGGARAFNLPIRPAPDPDISLEHGQVLEVGTLRFEQFKQWCAANDLDLAGVDAWIQESRRPSARAAAAAS